MLLIDTRDHRPPPDPERRRRRRPGWLGVAAPIAAAILCLALATVMPPLAAYGLTVLTLALVAFGLAKLLPDMGGLHKHRQ